MGVVRRMIRSSLPEQHGPWQSHLLVVLALLAALGLAIVANPLPTWIRTCAVASLLGGVLVGLTWPYLLGPLGAGPGVMAILVGG